MSLETQNSFQPPVPIFDVEIARRYSRMLNLGATNVSTQPTIKQEYPILIPNTMPYFKTDDAKGGFEAQMRDPFSPLLLDRVVGNLFIEPSRLINRRVNPFLTMGSLSTDVIGRQV